MKIAVLSDIHSNIDALRAVVQDAKEWGAEKFLVGGDTVGYGTAPDECVKILADLGALAIAGNHDWGVVKKTSIENFNAAAQEAIRWTRGHVSDKSREYLSSLSIRLEFEDITMVHANFTRPETWEYVLTLTRTAQEFKGFATTIGVIGHSHVPFIAMMPHAGRWPSQLPKTSVRLHPEERYLINVGSVGQPRDGDSRACYLRVDYRIERITLRRVAYDIEKARHRIRKMGLPLSLAERLSAGR